MNDEITTELTRGVPSPARRGKDQAADITKRAKSAVTEVGDALGPKASMLYDRVFHSAPEGPDGDDDWTREAKPVGRAAAVLAEFAAFVEERRRSSDR